MVWRCCRLQTFWTSWTKGYVLICLFATSFFYIPGFVLANIWFFSMICNKKYNRLYSWSHRKGEKLNGPNKFLEFLCCTGCKIFKDSTDDYDN
jgi:hypothetical protein